MSFFRPSSLRDKVKKEVEKAAGNSYESAIRSVGGVLESGLNEAIENGLPSPDEAINKLTDAVYDLPKTGTKFVARIGAKWIYAALEPVIRLVIGKYSDVQFGSCAEKAERKMEDSLKYLNTFLKGYSKSGCLVDSDYALIKELNESKLTGSDFEKQKKITEFYLSVHELSLGDYSPIRSVEGWKGADSESLEKVAYKLFEAIKSLKEAQEFFETAKEHMHDNVSSSLAVSVFDTTPAKISVFKDTLDYVIGHKLFNSLRPTESLKLIEMIKKIEESNVIQIRLERRFEKEKDLKNNSNDVGLFDYMDGNYSDIDGIKKIFARGFAERGEEFSFGIKEPDGEVRDQYYITLMGVAFKNPYGVLLMAIKEDRTDVILALNKLWENPELKKLFNVSEEELNFNKKTSENISLVQFAVREGAFNALGCLKDLGAAIDVVPDAGGNLLFEVKHCKKGALFMSKMYGKLMKYGLSIECKNNSGSTPLFDAIGCNCYDAITTLIESGADVMFENKNSIKSKIDDKINFSINLRATALEEINNRLESLFVGLDKSVENEVIKVDLNNYFNEVKKVVIEDTGDYSKTEEAIKRIGDNINDFLSHNKIESSVLVDFKELSKTVKKIKEVNNDIYFFEGIGDFVKFKISSQKINDVIDFNKNIFSDLSKKRMAIKDIVKPPEVNLKSDDFGIVNRLR